MIRVSEKCGDEINSSLTSKNSNKEKYRKRRNSLIYSDRIYHCRYNFSNAIEILAKF